MKFFATVLIFFISVMGFSQPDTGNNTIKLPAAPKNPVPENKPAIPKPEAKPFEIPPLYTPDVFNAKTEPEVKYKIGESGSNMIPEKFINQGQQYADKLNRKPDNGNSEDAAVIRRNQYFGDFKTKSQYVKIRYLDFGEEDGDLIKVLVNGKIVREQIRLYNDYSGFDLTLEPGFNKIDFEALNQGTSGPNTAQFEVYDDKGNLISAERWNLATGFKATVIMVKE